MRTLSYTAMFLGWTALNFACRWAGLNGVANALTVGTLALLALIVWLEYRRYEAREQIPVHRGWRDGHHVRQQLGAAPRGIGGRWVIDLDRRTALHIGPEARPRALYDRLQVVQPPVLVPSPQPRMPIEVEAQRVAAVEVAEADAIHNHYAAMADEATIRFQAITDDMSRQWDEAFAELGVRT